MVLLKGRVRHAGKRRENELIRDSRPEAGRPDWSLSKKLQKKTKGGAPLVVVHFWTSIINENLEQRLPETQWGSFCFNPEDYRGCHRIR